VLSGIEAGDRIVLNPPDSIIDGMPVHVAAAPTPKGGDRTS